MLKIYHMPNSRSDRVVWIAEELGLPHELVLKHRAELKLPDYLTLNPLGTAPAIEDGEAAMLESCAIVEYLADRYDTENRLSPPLRSAARAPYLQWLHFAEATLWPQIAAYLAAAGRFTGQPPNEPAMAEAKAKIANLVNFIDNTLARSPYIAGQTFSAADIAVYWALAICKMLRTFDERETKNVSAYAARIQERPAYRKAVTAPEGWTNQPPGSVPTPPVQRIS
ncbi:MAG: glutathione S-transferase family protein [Caulobacteraceae bacterium]|nr:glutathione S-transferase family protein [Caulobacteraceae bacterium]